MNWLAFDTATDMASFALKVADKCYVKHVEGVTQHAQMCLPIIDELLQQANIGVQDLSGIILGRGPGSFTGLRVACAVAKGLAWVHQTPIYALSHLEVIAFVAAKRYPAESILSVIDARMQQVYWCFYEKGQALATEHVSCMSNIHLPSGTSVVLAGYKYEDYLHLLPKDIKMIAQLPIRPDAQDMISMVETGNYQAVSAEILEPHYVRNQVTHGS
jgi:tRNA threonylcarbamoyladenosine biosynthesis protein TsaB